MQDFHPKSHKSGILACQPKALGLGKASVAELQPAITGSHPIRFPRGDPGRVPRSLHKPPFPSPYPLCSPSSGLRRLEIPRALLRRSSGNCCLALLSSLIHPASCVCVNHGRLAGTWSQLFCLSFETMALLISVFTCLSFAFLFSLIYLFQSQMLLLLLSIIVS